AVNTYAVSSRVVTVLFTPVGASLTAATVMLLAAVDALNALAPPESGVLYATSTLSTWKLPPSKVPLMTKRIRLSEDRYAPRSGRWEPGPGFALENVASVLYVARPSFEGSTETLPSSRSWLS